MTMLTGVFTPPDGDLWLEGQVFTTPWLRVTIERISKYAGSAIGNANVTFRSRYAREAAPEMGKRARIKIGGTTVFRGAVAHAPLVVDAKTDELSLTLFDDKWLMSSKTVGQIGIGTVGAVTGEEGFSDVGFDVVFNANGRPNKKLGLLDFSRGSTAQYWKLKEICEFLFQYYIDSNVATLVPGELTDNWTLEPSNLDLTGMSALQAVDTVAQLAGESWGLIPDNVASKFVRVKPGSGTVRSISMFAPEAGMSATNAGDSHASSAEVGGSIANCRDVYQAVSARIVIEHTYKSADADPLLTKVISFADPEYDVRWKVDVEKYSAHGLGNNLSADSPPKPWLSHLVTRLNDDGDNYYTAAEIAGKPSRRYAQPVAEPVVWVSSDGATANLALCTGGYRIDYRNGTIDLKNTVTLMVDSDGDSNADKEVDVKIGNWSIAVVWITVATVIELPESKITDTSSSYLPTPFHQVIRKPDLVPERRFMADLPDLTKTDKNARTSVGFGAEEKYIDIGDYLDDAINAAIDASPEIEMDGRFGFPFVPIMNVGDRVAVTGRDLGLTGAEVITEVTYNVHQSYEAHIRVTNVTSGLDPDNFLEVE